MELLDLLPYETALQRLLRAGVCGDDQMHDYNASQALRSLMYAVNRASLPAPLLDLSQPQSPPSHPLHGAATRTSSLPHCTTAGTPTTTTAINATSRGNIAVLCRMCTSSLASYRNLQTTVYLSTRLLCDEATAFGEGNERPCCSVAWVEALCSPGNNSYLREQMAVHRRLALGYMFLLAGTVRMVGHGCVAGKRLTSHFSEFTQRILDDVLPYLALIADAKDGHVSSECVHSSGVVLEDADLVALRTPSRLTVEANNTIMHLFHDIALDVMEVHCGGTKHMGSRPAVLDRDTPNRIWPVVSILRGAFSRALGWIQNETLWHIRSGDLPHASKQIQGINESMSVIRSVLEATFASLVKQQETLECTRRVVERQFGLNAKDYHEATDMMWSNTLRLCYLCRSVSNAWMQIHGGAGGTEVQQTDKKALGLIASLVSSAASLDGDETDSNVFITSTALVSAVFVVVVAAPAPFMQAALWLADLALTQQVHNVIIQRTLRYKDENVQRLSALLSQMILYSSSTSSAFRVISDSSDQLLELLSDGRDAASRCVTGMVTRAAIHRPYAVLPALFRLLQHGDLRTRHNVLDVLSSLPRACDNSFYGDGLTAEQMRPILRLLSEELLLRLHDEELFIRLESSRLFAKVWPEDVCRPLLHLSTQRDKSAKRQSAAQHALQCVVEAHTQNSDIVLLLIMESVALLGEGPPPIRTAPSTPSDILALSKLHTCTVVDGGEEEDPNAVNARSEKVSGRLVRLLLSLVRRWAEVVSTWTQSLIDPIVKRVMQACRPLEEEIVVRVMGQVASVCGATDDGATALLSSCLCIIRSGGNGEDGTTQSSLWLDTLTAHVDGHTATPTTTTRSTHDSNCFAYQMVAPLLCLRGCPRRAFISDATKGMPPLLVELWEILWMILLSPSYRNILSADAQRLLLELVCKYNTHMVLQKLSDLEIQYLENKTPACDASLSHGRFVCRVGFFCIGVLLSRNKAAFHNMGATSDATLEDERAESELQDLMSGAMMVVRWTEQMVLPWLLCDDNESAHDATFLADAQRLSRSAVESMALLVVVALNRKEFDEAVVAPMMLPLTELVTLYRQQVKHLGEVSGEVDRSAASYDVSTRLLGRFEFAVQVQRCALGLLGTYLAGREMVCLWIARYMPCFIDLANAFCAAAAAAARFCRNDLGQVAVECCHVLFLAVMVSSGASPLHSNGAVPSLQQQRERKNEYPAATTLMRLDATDRSALLSFALGSAKYSTLPQVQSEGVKLLSALLGAAPELFADDSAWSDATFMESFGVLRSVALMHPDSKTRALAEQVLEAIQQNEKQ